MNRVSANAPKLYPFTITMSPLSSTEAQESG